MLITELNAGEERNLHCHALMLSVHACAAKALRQDAQKFAEVMRDVETALISASDLGKHQECLKTIGSVLDEAAEHLKRLQTANYLSKLTWAKHDREKFSGFRDQLSLSALIALYALVGMQHDLPMSRRAVPTSAPTSSIAAASEALLTPPCTSMDAARLMLSLVPKAAPAPRPASNARPPGATARSWGSEVGLLFPQPMLTGFRGGGAVAVSFNVRWRDE